MLIKKPVFPSLRAAVNFISMTTLSPYAKNCGNSIDATVTERTYEMEEFQYRDGESICYVTALWGDSDFFFMYRDDNGDLIIVDGVYNDDTSYVKIDDDILNLLKRCMEVGYIPRSLLRAISELGRGAPEGEFVNIFGDCIDHVEDILQALEVQDEA